ncbi:MAG TPA: tRNA (adenosine(37)-N6)-dimethylallyltransferase MiaA [Saprospiraceae bacterium]|nr:tRNA (adenosine(37)-N6)-dimethylallyltransferase MiaA [Saprospiraceae bacterium]
MINQHQNPQKILIVLAGPTAVGKTKLAMKLAGRYHCEIISADSRQIYKELQIGTAKPPEEYTTTITHHMIDVVSIHESFDVATFETQALMLLERLFQNHSIIILCGGTGLYIQAVLYGLDPFPNIEKKVKDTWNQLYDEHGIQYLRDQLAESDPTYFQTVDLSNPHRLLRALTVMQVSGRPYSSFLTGQSAKRYFQPVKILLERPRDELYDRIHQRIDEMMDSGFLDEVKALQSHTHLPALNTLGYQELIAYLEGKYSLSRAIELMKQNTRRYAKRQLTWFKNKDNFQIFHPNDERTIIQYIDSQLNKL